MKLTIAGESHGKAICGILTNVPSGIKLDENHINSILAERNGAFGRSERQLFENDKIEIISGVRGGYTLGDNLSFLIKNAAHEERLADMDVWDTSESARARNAKTAPRAGHADLSGLLKFGFNDITDVSEGASARFTCAFTAGGAIALSFLNALGIEIEAGVCGIGDYDEFFTPSFSTVKKAKPPLYLINDEKTESVRAFVKQAENRGDTLGGKVVISAKNVKAGFGSYVCEKRVNGLIAALLMQMPAVRGVYFGDNPFNNPTGIERADLIGYNENAGGFFRFSNHSGGIEGGMTNGEEISVTVAIRPVPTLKRETETADYISKNTVAAFSPRSDVTAVFAACPILKCMLALALSEAVCDRLGCDNLADIKERYDKLP